MVMCFSGSTRLFSGSSPFVVLAISIGLSGCAGRPTSEVLHPTSIAQPQRQNVTLLAVTNRDDTAKDGNFGSQWGSEVSYEQFEFSIPDQRQGAVIAFPSRKPDPRRQYVVTRREQVSRDALLSKLVGAKNFDGTAVVFVHGYNYSYQEALFRAAQMAADAKSPAPPIVFSWPSAASLTGYVADRDAATYSRNQLTDLLQAISKERKVEHILLIAHSMGGYLSMEAARQLKLQKRDDVLAKLQVVLAAPDIDVEVFRSQLHDVGILPTPVTLLVSNSDRALSVSSLVGGERPRVGQLDIDDPIIQETAKAEHVTVIDISSLASSDGLGHDRYASLARFSSEITKADAGMRINGGNIGAFVFDAAGAAVASPFRLASKLTKR